MRGINWGAYEQTKYTFNGHRFGIVTIRLR